MTDQPSRDDLLQAAANLKEEMTELHNRLSELALVFTDSDDGGALASQLVTSTQEVTTWAEVYATFGPDAIKPTDPLNKAWWRAILKTDNPAHWLEQARTRQLGAAQIRAEAGVKQERKPPWYDGSGTYEPDKIAIYLDAEPEDSTPRRVALRVREKDE
jgi:hypothetical protein